ncbi:MAG: hypothetical protein JHC33_10600 [Ignisphaera sp.]|nr:hypothetical protein [Ignisphaera sp.]
MLEKSGSVTLTDKDLEEYNKGIVSDRIAETWKLSYNELRDVVENKSYILVSCNNN